MKNDSNNAAKQMIARYPDLKPYQVNITTYFPTKETSQSA